MHSLKVLQIIDSLNVGGAEMMVVNIANTLQENNIDTFLCTTRKEGDLKKKLNKEVGYLFLNRRYRFDGKAFLKLNKFIKLNKITLIHAHSNSYFFASLIKWVNPKIVLIWHNHTGANINMKGGRLKILRFFSKKFNVSIHVNQPLLEWGKANLKSIESVYLPNFSVLDCEIKKTRLKGVKGKRIVCVAGFRPEKDHLNLLKAFVKIHKKFPSWSLHLIGKGYKDKYESSITSFIKDMKLKECVFIYGIRSDIAAILAQATIGVLSSKSEGLPISLLEYGLAKLPVVVTEVGECATVIQNRDSGLLVPPKNPNLLAKAIIELIKEPDKRNKLAIALNKQINKNYSKNAFTKKLIALYTIQ